MHTIRRCLGALTSLLAATATAVVVTTAAVAAPGDVTAAGPTSCPQYEAMLRTYAPAGGWDVAQMSAIIARESGCVATAKSAHDSGLLQINQVNYTYLTNVLGEPVTRESLGDPAQNIRAGAALCSYWQGRGESCYFPWKLDLYRPPAGSQATAAATPTAATTTTTTTAPAPVAGRCTQYEALLAANAPKGGWDVQKMSQLMWRTSRCNPAKRTGGVTGLLGISASHGAALTKQLGTKVDRTTLTDPALNIRAAAALCQWSVGIGRSCYRPWGG
ncbi:MAG: transglycosylase SLT domain-containing protein [Ilumatobacteraceae bacterium]